MIPPVSPPPRHYQSATLDGAGSFAWGARTYVMGVINVTPDSFSGDGTSGDVERAVALAREMEAAGADLLDIGGESSRPGAEPLDEGEERRRVVPAIAAIRDALSLPLSVDTYHASVAEAAIDAGATIVNDIFGLRFDPRMAGVVARTGVALIAMHNQRGREFSGDVALDITSGFFESISLADEAGVPRERLILDPGFGFGWSVSQNLEMLRRLPELWGLELPLLLGVSRKSTIGAVTGAAVEDRLPGTSAAVALSIAGGADIVRVHDVRELRPVVRMSDAIVRGWQE